VRFAYEGTEYEIDLSKKNAAAFHKQLTPYLEHARKAGQGPARRRGRTVASRQEVVPSSVELRWRSRWPSGHLRVSLLLTGVTFGRGPAMAWPCWG
jgi:hypothetical protein